MNTDNLPHETTVFDVSMVSDKTCHLTAVCTSVTEDNHLEDKEMGVPEQMLFYSTDELLIMVIKVCDYCVKFRISFVPVENATSLVSVSDAGNSSTISATALSGITYVYCACVVVACYS